MPFLSSELFKERLSELVIHPDARRVRHGAYELSLGREVVLSGDVVKRHLALYEQISIPAGQFALLMTEETVRVPPDLIAFISMRSGAKLNGLINVSGFHVDPGFTGCLLFSVYNAGPNPAALTRGEPLFLIWYAKLDRSTSDTYNGSHNGQTIITDAMVNATRGELASPAALLARMDDLEHRFVSFRAAVMYIGGVAVGLLVALIANVLAIRMTTPASAPPAPSAAASPTVQTTSSPSPAHEVPQRR